MRNVYEGAAIRSLYRQLVDDFGGFDAAATFLKCSKGTLSKQCHGDAAIGPEHFGAQDTLREAADLTPAIFALLINGDAGPILKEGPEAIAALADLLRAVDADPAEGRRK